MRIYLAGPIRGKTYAEATDWREYVATYLRAIGHQPISPMRGKEALKNYGPLHGSVSDGSYPEFPLSSGHGLFMRDVFDVQQCDMVLANFADAAQLSIGTCMEVAMAYILRKYVLSIIPSGNLHDHAFLQQASSLVVPTLEDALEYLKVVAQPYAGSPTWQPAREINRWRLPPS